MDTPELPPGEIDRPPATEAWQAADTKLQELQDDLMRFSLNRRTARDTQEQAAFEGKMLATLALLSGAIYSVEEPAALVITAQRSRLCPFTRWASEHLDFMDYQEDGLRFRSFYLPRRNLLMVRVSETDLYHLEVDLCSRGISSFNLGLDLDCMGLSVESADGPPAAL